MPIPIAETPLYKEGKLEGLQEGLQKGLQEGLLKGRVEGMKVALIEDIELKFGTVPKQLEEHIMDVTDTNILKAYKKALFSSQTLEEFLEKIK